MEFLKSKFDLLLVTVALLIVGSVWIQFNFEVKLEPYVFALFGSWLTVLGLRPRPDQRTNIQAENIESASTESGDVVVKTDSMITKSEKEI